MNILNLLEREREKGWERMEELLCDAAIRGDLESLHKIIAKDNYILDKVLVGSFKGKNPLHVATSTGQAEFVLELLEIKPKLAEVVDMELGAALHIASANGDLKIVEALVKLSPEMCMARDRDGNNPLHIAAMKGKVDVLKKLIQTCPRAIQVIVDRGDTILHLCVNYNQLESLQLLLENEMIRDSKMVQSKDANGNTILHVAVLGMRFEILEYVLNKTEINVNAINEAGWSVLDSYYFVQNQPHREGVDVRIENLLRTAGERQIKYTISPKGTEYLVQTLSVVASLFATMAFQVGVNPPGGVWQDDSKEHLVGKAILAYKYPKSYLYFMYINTVGFLLSLLIIIEFQVFHVPGRIGCWVWVLPIRSLFTIMITVFAYTYSIIVVSPKHMATNRILFLVIGWTFLMLLFAVWRMVVNERARPKDREKISRSARDRPRLLPNAVGGNVSSV